MLIFFLLLTHAALGQQINVEEQRKSLFFEGSCFPSYFLFIWMAEIQWYAGKYLLVHWSALSLGWREGGSPVCNICQFLWYKYSYCGWVQATNLTSGCKISCANTRWLQHTTGDFKKSYSVDGKYHWPLGPAPDSGSTPGVCPQWELSKYRWWG